MYWNADNSSYRLWYQDLGSGTPLVLIHGWCMSSVVWDKQIDELSESFRIVTVDLPGHGYSEPLPGGFSQNGCAESIAGLLSHLELRNALLAGWSLGAQIAIATISLLRERFSGLVLIGATPRFTRTDDFPYGLSPEEAEGMALKVKRNIQRARDGFLARMFTPEELQDTVQAAHIHDLLASVPLPDTSSALQALQSLAEADIRNDLTLIDLPTLIMNGEHDVICLQGASDYMADNIPLSRREVFPASGHAPFLTRSSRFNTCLIEFVESVSVRNIRQK